MKLKPQADRVLLKEIKEKETNKEIILVPNDSNKTKIYEVLDKGIECSDRLNIGDYVICTKYIDGEVKDGIDVYYLTKEINVLGVIEFK